MVVALQGSGTYSAGWVGTTAALSLLVIAASFATIAAVAAMAARRAAREMQEVTRLMELLRQDLGPALTALTGIATDGKRVVSVLASEAEELARGSRMVREAVAQRLGDLDAVYQVLQEEVEEAALDVATTLRTFRTGHGWYSRLRRLVGGGRRR